LNSEDSDIEERALRLFYGPTKEFIEECEDNQREVMSILGNVLNRPMHSHAAAAMLTETVRSYQFSLYVGSILLAAMAIEVELREFVQRWFTTFTQEPQKSGVQSLIEELDFRRIIEFCKTHELLENSKDDVYGKLHLCYDLRNKYSHAKFSQILEEKAKQFSGEPGQTGGHKRFGPPGDNPFLQAIYLATKIAHDDALAIIRAVAESFDAVTRDLRSQRSGNES
jgi:hypothetical protein